MLLEAIDAYIEDADGKMTHEEAFREILENFVEPHDELWTQVVAASDARTTEAANHHRMFLGRLVQKGMEKFLTERYPEEMMCTGPEHLDELRMKAVDDHNYQLRIWNKERGESMQP